ncbi:MAG: hypothetical protein GY767_07940 [Shimia sp.]|nr:hypothetical protein [Shimia sp.]
MKGADELEVIRSWRALFLNDDGSLRDNAGAVLRDLEAICQAMRTDLPVDDQSRVDPSRVVEIHAKRAVFITAKKRLFGPIGHLTERK